MAKEFKYTTSTTLQPEVGLHKKGRTPGNGPEKTKTGLVSREKS